MQQVLLVDDSPDWREQMEWAADAPDRHLTIAQTAGEAIRKIFDGNFDLVVTDLQLPHEEGYIPDIEGGLSILKAAKEKDPYTQVIVCTAAGTEAVSVRAMRSGAFDYLERAPAATSHLQMLKRKIDLALEFRALKLKEAQVI